MYNEFFGLKDAPFSIAPDPRYLYMSERHREALAHLLYGIDSNGGFVLLTGEVGTGKTTVCRCLLEQIPELTEVSLIFNPKLNAEELLGTVCDELGIAYPEGNSSIKVFVDRINAHLLTAHAQGRNTVLIIDEAQNLSIEVLEQLRLLTNLETNERKLLQIILLGQPELHDKLARPELRQLAQRITARYYLAPLSQSEISDYIRYRLRVAGSQDSIFQNSSLGKLYRLSGGVPRLINLLCDRALLGAYSQDQKFVDSKTLSKAAREVFGEDEPRPRSAGKLPWMILSMALAVGAGLGVAYYFTPKEPTALPVPSVSTHIRAEQTDPVKSPPASARLQWPDSDDLEVSRSTAFTEILKLWNIPYFPDADGSACLKARANGLQCMMNKGSLQTLFYLNRPARLELRNARGEQLYVVLKRIDKDTAELFLAGKSVTLSLKELERQWFGRFTLLWRTPPGYKDSIRPGMRGDAVKWLATQMSFIQGSTPPGEGKTKYGKDLEEQVMAFQQSQGLIPDGVVGAQTIIRINTIQGEDVPLLMDREKN